MPVRIGENPHHFTDPSGFLSDCHRRIEMFIGSLQQVASDIDRPLTEEARIALESALRYFREAAPKHTADEEQSLFPRLRRISHPDVESALGSLEALEGEHRWAETAHAEVEALGNKCLANGSLSPAESEVFREAVGGLASMYAEHIRIEDDLVFPVAARLLSDPDRAAIANEMAARRSATFVSTIPHG